MAAMDDIKTDTDDQGVVWDDIDAANSITRATKGCARRAFSHSACRRLAAPVSDDRWYCDAQGAPWTAPVLRAKRPSHQRQVTPVYRCEAA